MKTKIHIILVRLLVCPVLFLGSCSGHDDEMPARGEGPESVLVLRVGTIGRTRSGAADTDIERMHSLRVVILNDAGEVEHNFYTSFSQGLEEYTHRFGVAPGKKKIFLIANEESVYYLTGEDGDGATAPLGDLLADVSVGSSGFENSINAVCFRPDYTSDEVQRYGIPLTSEYELTLGPETTEAERTMTLYLVRVATKFTVNFENRRAEDVTVSAFTIGKVSDTNYLMPHLNVHNALFDGFPTWIDWLKDVSDKSNADPYDPSADESGWLTEYELPIDAQSKDYEYAGPILVPAKTESDGGTEYGTKSVERIYIPESKSVKDGSSDSGEQEYKMSLTLTIDGEDRLFECVLPNLKALFRNTHVVVNVRFGKQEYPVIYAGIVYWGFYDSVQGFVEEEE